MVPERLAPVLDEVRPLAERLAAGGHRAYLVGGTVRDLLLGRDLESVDFDLTTDARPDDIEQVVRGWADAVWTQGKRFGTIGCRKDGRDFEITTHRAEAYRPDSRKPDVRFADAVEADLSRRDFTVNAMALRVGPTAGEAGDEPQLVDPFGGATDLAAGRLRTPLSPGESFTDDPLRMLRAARFIAAHGLAPEPELVETVRHLHPRLEVVSAERIRDELDKLLVVERPET
ncbi:MAG TPA: CCA tRNA nucleotidyltransferase, partial [Acidimicrobiales bacterium]|nr:CCA tRNA nucleotidyltransferase [Acidimicrobiales bacterium]